MPSIAPQDQAEVLFPGFEPPAPLPAEPKVSADRSRTLRQTAAIAMGLHPLSLVIRGLQLHPLASRHRDAASPKDDPFTCGSCYFRQAFDHHTRAYLKCTFGLTAEMPYLTSSPRISASATTDIRSWWPACTDYSPGSDISPDAARSIPEDDA